MNAPELRPPPLPIQQAAAARAIFEARHNPPGLGVSTWLGRFATDDGATWRSADGAYAATLERMASGAVVLRLWHRDRLLGRVDARGWHPPTERTRQRRRPARRRRLPRLG